MTKRLAHRVIFPIKHPRSISTKCPAQIDLALPLDLDLDLVIN